MSTELEDNTYTVTWESGIEAVGEIEAALDAWKSMRDATSKKGYHMQITVESADGAGMHVDVCDGAVEILDSWGSEETSK